MRSVIVFLLLVAIGMSTVMGSPRKPSMTAAQKQKVNADFTKRTITLLQKRCTEKEKVEAEQLFKEMDNTYRGAFIDGNGNKDKVKEYLARCP